MIKNRLSYIRQKIKRDPFILFFMVYDYLEIFTFIISSLWPYIKRKIDMNSLNFEYLLLRVTF